MKQEVLISESKPLTVAARDGILVPRLIAAAGDQAARRFLEFFAATIRNKNTRMAHYRATVRFFAWRDHHKIGEIADIEPLHVAAYVEALGKELEKPTVKQHLAAIRMRPRPNSLVTRGQLSASWLRQRSSCLQSVTPKPGRFLPRHLTPEERAKPRA